jgi:tetratricopeptide (TPR) repeat protein
MSEMDQLERILKSAPLVTSPSLSRFLRYIVEETLAGRNAAIREYTLGVHVFDRGEDFNPRLDPIVRVQARNLRARVAKYYETQGAEDPIFIELPKGTYVPIFHQRVLDLSPTEPDLPIALPAPPVITAASIMPVPPPRSPVAGRRGETSRYLIAAVVLLVILIGIATLWLTQMHAAPGLMQPGTLAQDLYIRGRYALDRETGASLQEGVKCFEQAVAYAPNYAAAHAGLADAYNIQAQFGLTAPREAMEKARAEARRAIELDPHLAEGHVAMAAILEAYDWNWKSAEREYRRALVLNPGLAAAHLWYGMFLRDQGRMTEALPELRRAAQLQPSSVLTTVNLAYGLLEQGDTAAAFEQARRAVQMAPDHPTASIILVYAAQAMQRPDDAQAALAQAQRAAAGNPHSLALVAVALARHGRREESLRVSHELDALARSQYVSPYDLGKVSLILGDEERAFGFFEEAMRQRSSGLIFLRNVRGCVRNTPRFDSLVNQLHLQG